MRSPRACQFWYAVQSVEMSVCIGAMRPRPTEGVPTRSPPSGSTPSFRARRSVRRAARERWRAPRPGSGGGMRA